MSDSYSCFMWQSVMELNQHLEAAENDGGNWAQFKNYNLLLICSSIFN